MNIVSLLSNQPTNVVIYPMLLKLFYTLMKYYHQMITTMVDKIVTIKTQHKTLEGMRTAKILNIFNVYSINDIKNKKIIFFVCIYKMVNITKEMYENNGIEVITDNLNTLWLNERHVEQQLGHKNLRKVTNKYDKKYRKC